MTSMNFYIFMHFMSIYLHFIYIYLVFIDFYYLFISRIIHLIFLLSLRQKWSSGGRNGCGPKEKRCFLRKKTTLFLHDFYSFILMRPAGPGRFR